MDGGNAQVAIGVQFMQAIAITQDYRYIQSNLPETDFSRLAVEYEG